MIDFDSFLQWAEDRFPGNVVVKGNEVKINSIFAEDQGHHLWCSVSGGKYHREDGCYRCFYTENKGTLIGLVMLVDQCSYEEARDVLSGRTPIGVLEERMEKMFAELDGNYFTPKPENKLKLPESCFLISEMSAASLYRMEAESYLTSRKLPINGLYYCTGGEFRNRIVIPYYDAVGKLIYWNSRHLNKKIQPRYRGPDKSVGVGKGDVLYLPRWPEDGSKVYLTEGEFDTLTLFLCGFSGVACGGKTLSDIQLEMLRSRQYKVCLCPDNDKRVLESAAPGRVAMVEMAKKLFSVFLSVSYVFPPKVFKDWNDMLVAHKPAIITEYIREMERSLDPLILEQMLCLT